MSQSVPGRCVRIRRVGGAKRRGGGEDGGIETHRVHGLSVVLEAGGRAILAIAAVDQSALRTGISIARLEKAREESTRGRAYRVARIVEGVASAENAAGIELRRAPSSWREGVSWLATNESLRARMETGDQSCDMSRRGVYLLHRSLSPMLFVLMVKFWKVLFCAAATESAESATRATFWRMVAKREGGRLGDSATGPRMLGK